MQIKTLGIILFSLVISLVGIKESVSQTLSGIISDTLKSQTYVVLNTIFVEDTLVINPGTKLVFEEDAALIINGLLIAIGTENDSIIFTSNVPKYGKGLVFENTSNNNSILNYCVIENFKTSGITINSSNPLLNNLSIRNNFGINGGGIYSYNSDFRIFNSAIYNNTSFNKGGGLFLNGEVTCANLLIYNNASQAGGSAIYSNDTSNHIRIINSTINKNKDYLQPSGKSVFFNISNSSSANISNSIISYNLDIGISKSLTGNVFVEYCNIYDNYIEDFNNFNSDYGNNIYKNVNSYSCDKYQNISLQPEYVNVNNNDYSFKANSPCIDAGLNSAIINSGNTAYKIYDGNLDDDNIIDIGYKEFLYNNTIEISYTKNNTSYPGINDGKIEVSINGNNPPFRHIWFSGHDSLTIDSLNPGKYFIGVLDDLNYYKQISIEIKNPEFYNISGKIHKNNGEDFSGVILLEEENGSDIFLRQITKSSNNTFVFDTVLLGKYLIHAIPNPSLGNDFLPTYYVNKLSWKNAIRIDVFGDVYDIDLNLKSKENITEGGGMICGKITFNNERDFNTELRSIDWFETGFVYDENSNSAINIPIILLNENNEIISWTLTDENGEYEFEKLPFGNYNLQVESPGKEINSIISISEELPTSCDNNFNISSEKNNTKSNINKNDISVFPNPNNGKFLVQNSVSGTIRIYNLNGKLILNESLNTSRNIDMSNYPKGLYILQYISEDNIEIENIIIE